jgi:hypothetical protein
MSAALKSNLDEVLLIQDNTKNNCLHTAMMDPRRTIIIDLIKRVQSPSTFCAKNDDKLTPMHLAVEYERCSEKQLEIIDAMIQYWDADHTALDVNVLGEDSDECEERSVFRHHQWTRERAVKSIPLRNNVPAKDIAPAKESALGKDVAPGKESIMGKTTSTGKDSVKNNATQSPIEKPGKNATFEKDPSGLGHPANSSQPVKPPAPSSGPKSGIKPPASAAKAEIQQGIARKPTFIERDTPKHEGAKQDNPTTNKADGQPKPTEKDKIKSDTTKTADRTHDTTETKAPKMSQEEAADKIRERLKMRYMLTRDDHRQILSFLYGPNEG